MTQFARLRSVACALSIALPIAAACTAVGGAKEPQRDPGEWQVHYVTAGGLAFYTHALMVTRAGELRATDTRLGDDVTGRAANDLVTTIDAYLKTAREAKKTAPMPDAISTSLVLTSVGQKDELALTRDIQARLDVAWDAAVSAALVGSWRQSGWKLCNPAAQLTAADTDTPIDDLTFRSDGTFGVMWRGGGAYTADIPHVFVPHSDYDGTYSATPSTGALSMRSTSPLMTLRDFSGQGRFRIAGAELTLINIWLGTRQAPHKPDICELTFTKQ
jgi:hypothetical protein